MENIVFKVDRITPSTKGGSIVRIVEVKNSNVVATPIGDMKASAFGRKFLLKVEKLNPEIKIGTKFPLNLDSFNQVERTFVSEQPDTFGETKIVTWLFPK